MNRVKRSVSLPSLAVALVALAAACAPTAAPSPTAAPAKSAEAPAANPAEAKLNQLYESAKNEGELIWAGSGGPDVYGPVANLFQSRFPGIKVTVVDLPGPQVIQRVVAESQAKRVTADVFIGGAVSVMSLIERDLVLPHDFSDTSASPNDVILDNKLLLVTDVVVPWYYNKNLVSPDDVPRKPEDLLNPKFRGKIAVVKTGDGWEMWDGIWDQAKVISFVKQLADAKQLTLLATFGSEGVDKAARGEVLLTNSQALYRGMVNIEQGAPLDLAPIGAQVDLAGVFTVPGSPHPRLAELFVQWMTTPEAREAMAKVGRGRLQPCTGPGSQDQFVCGKNLDLYYMDTVDKIKRSIPQRDEIARILGSYD